MSEGKGKARAAQIDEEKNVSSKAFGDPSSSTHSSMLGRIGTSANSLGRSIVSPPQHGSELNNLSATALASSDKGVSNGHRGASVSVGGSVVTSPHGLSSTKSASDTIRSRNHETRSTEVEAEFSDFLNSTDGAPFDYNLSHSRDAETHAAQAEAKFSSLLDNAEPLTLPEDQSPLSLEYESSIIQTNRMGSHRTVAMQEAADGEAVSDLLSDPDFHENVSNSLSLNNLNNHSIQDEDESYWRTEEATLVKLIQQDRISKDTAVIADAIKSRPDLSKSGPWNTEDGSKFLAELEHIEDKNSEIHQWYRFLTSYQEDVWGDLGPLVGEAREELKTWTPEKGDLLQQPTALRRLNLILGHFRR